MSLKCVNIISIFQASFYVHFCNFLEKEKYLNIKKNKKQKIIKKTTIKTMNTSKAITRRLSLTLHHKLLNEITVRESLWLNLSE